MEYDELINKYFSNQLTGEEKRLFEGLLKSDQAFQEEFDFHSNLKRAITDTKREQSKGILQEVENDIGATGPPKFTINWRRLSIAASVLLLIGFGWYAGIFTGPDMQGLYTENYEAYPNTEYTIDRSSDENTLKRRAFVAYEKNDYAAAILLFEELSTQGEPNIDFYLGQSYLGNNQAEEAILVFKDIISGNDVYTEESKWYLALAYLKDDDKENAIAQLKEIKTGYNQKEANRLLEELD